jgi:hypothetical protein
MILREEISYEASIRDYQGVFTIVVVFLWPIEVEVERVIR